MPPEYLQMFLSEDESLPDPDAVLGLEEGGGPQPPAEPPSLEELLRDPDVAAIVEAADGLEPVGA
jgi:hypothetical protein